MMVTATVQPAVLPKLANRGCGKARSGLYGTTAPIEDLEELSFNLIDPVIPVDPAMEQDMSKQGQNIFMGPNGLYATDWVGVGGYPCSADFIWESIKKGTSNRLPWFESLKKNQEFYGAYQRGLEIYYVHPKAYIHPDDREYFFMERQKAYFWGKTGCPFNFPAHNKKDDNPLSMEPWPMCAGLQFDDLPMDSLSTRVQGHPRLVDRSVGDLFYRGYTAPVNNVRRMPGFFYRVKLAGFEIVMNDPSEEEKAQEIMDILGNIVNLPVVRKEF